MDDGKDGAAAPVAAGGAQPASVSTPLARHIVQAIAAAGGWLSFERYMHEALYAPGLGYYARAGRVFGRLPGDGSDYVTAPELSPLYGRALARQVAQWLDAAQADTVWEFGAGSGALAGQLIDALGPRLRRYVIVEVSPTLAARQRERLAGHGDRVEWASQWPDRLHGVVVGNEVLDAMPVQLLRYDGVRWLERGVVVGGDGGFAWADRPTDQRPPVDADFVPGALTELHRQACAFVAGVAERLDRGAALFVDYGFPAAEYHHRQRSGGTLMCHRAHRADADLLADVGAKDISAHVDFSAVALAAQDAGADVLGYTSQARFLINCGLLELLATADWRARADVQKLLTEHEMGELFKVLAFGRGVAGAPLGFARGDRTHTL
jgi:SAM-dependent MidA family methyltransferase